MVTAPAVWLGVKRMTGTDLIVAAPWIVFAVVLAAIGIFLLRSRRASRPDHGEPAQDPHSEEERCPPQNHETRRP
jgi:hypothetical protein